MPYKVAVVDDDSVNLRFVRRILIENKMDVFPLNSGKALLEYMKVNTADIILLDIMMPEMDGIETLKRLRKFERENALVETPVIFLTGKDNEDDETRGLEMGAMDFIRKPFAPKILMLRVMHCVELVKLQNDLAHEVELKTQSYQNLSLQIVETLAETIEAKDLYTKGHSRRVALYSLELAKRFGFDKETRDRIFIMGLLHDVGKIGIPDQIINKEGRLSDEEYAIIKTHPGKGAKILEAVEEMPELSVGAHWHHERYDGKGYPDGLSGVSIPIEARIIAVADAYDAMSSRRSYRSTLSQEVVRAEIEKGKGTQFDPVFADIMLQMIDEDTEYTMREIKEQL